MNNRFAIITKTGNVPASMDAAKPAASSTPEANAKAHRPAHPRVTWLLPVRNGMPFLPATLASIEAQTYKGAQIIAWDNGSTDGTAAELRKWIPSRIPGRVISGQPQGLGASLASMTSMARTEYCARIDADDINLPHRLQTQLDFMDAHSDVAVVGSAVKLIGEQDEMLGDGAAPVCHDADIRWRLRFCNAISHPTVMFRRSAILAAGNYADIMPIEDFDLWCRVAMRFEIANLPDQLVRYRVSNSSVSGKHRHKIDTIRRQTIEHYGPVLFGDAPTPVVSRLLDLLTVPNPQNVNFSDLRHLHNAATNAAIQIGQKSDYFRQTELYKIQRRALTALWAKALPGAQAVWPLLRYAANHRGFQRATDSSANTHHAKAA